MKINPFLLLYQYLIVLPVVLVLTIITALLTIIMSPFAPNSRVTNFPARWWSRLICYLFFIRVKVSGLEKSDPAKSYVFVFRIISLFLTFLFCMAGYRIYLSGS